MPKGLVHALVFENRSSWKFYFAETVKDRDDSPVILEVVQYLFLPFLVDHPLHHQLVIIMVQPTHPPQNFQKKKKKHTIMLQK